MTLFGKDMKRPPAILAAIALLAFFVANLALIAHRTQQPSRYLIGGYRGVALLGAFAVLLFLFPRIGRWVAGVFFLFVGLAFLPSAIRSLAVTTCAGSAVTLVVAVWLFRTEMPVAGETKGKTEA